MSSKKRKRGHAGTPAGRGGALDGEQFLGIDGLVDGREVAGKMGGESFLRRGWFGIGMRFSPFE
jgi:hypothetical protein